MMKRFGWIEQKSYIWGQLFRTKEMEAIKNPYADQSLDQEVQMVMETATTYGVARKKPTFTEVMENKMMMISLIKRGIPYPLFAKIQALTPFEEEDWVNILEVSSKTLDRYKQGKKTFKSLQSEKILEMAEVTKVGLEVFGTSEQFKIWLETPNFALGSFKPKDLLTDSYGKEMVLSELVRIDQGIFV